MKTYEIKAEAVNGFSYRSECLTWVYDKMSSEIKEDYYHNLFDGDISSIYYDENNQLVGFVLAKSNETDCFIYGYSSCNEDVKTVIFRQFIGEIKGRQKGKAGKRFKAKYITITVDCEEEKNIAFFENLRFKQIDNSARYVLNIRV